MERHELNGICPIATHAGRCCTHSDYNKHLSLLMSCYGNITSYAHTFTSFVSVNCGDFP